MAQHDVFYVCCVVLMYVSVWLCRSECVTFKYVIHLPGTGIFIPRFHQPNFFNLAFNELLPNFYPKFTETYLDNEPIASLKR